MWAHDEVRSAAGTGLCVHRMGKHGVPIIRGDDEKILSPRADGRGDYPMILLEMRVRGNAALALDEMFDRYPVRVRRTLFGKS